MAKKEGLMAYCVKTKKKEEMVEATIVKTKRGGFMAKGKTAEGHSVVCILSEEKANKYIVDGIAKKGY